jgi:hypothetical protein
MISGNVLPGFSAAGVDLGTEDISENEIPLCFDSQGEQISGNSSCTQKPQKLSDSQK